MGETTGASGASGAEGADVAALAALLREAEEHHGQYEATAPKHHWSDWYAAFIVAREAGRTPGEAVEEAGQHMTEVLKS